MFCLLLDKKDDEFCLRSSLEKYVIQHFLNDTYNLLSK